MSALTNGIDAGGRSLAADRCIFFRPKFKRWTRATDRAEYFRRADAKYAPQSSGSAATHHLYVNAPAARIIEAALRSAFGRNEQLGGVTIGEIEATEIEKLLRAMVTREHRPEMRARIKIVADEFTRARAKDSVVTIINADPSVLAKDVRAAEQEEENHRAILLAIGGSFSERFVRRFLSQGETAIVLGRFRQVRPDVATTLQIVNELPVLLMSGKWHNLGLSSTEAERLWYLFVKLLIEEHGERARAILKYGDPKHSRKVAQRIGREMAGGVRKPPRTTKKQSGGGRKS